MSRKLILASTISLILAGTDASALGLGGLRTQSALNQPFVGEIDLQDLKPEELDAVKVSLASQHAFDKAGLERYYYLTQLRFTPAVSQGKPLIRVSSREPIREPYMDLLIEAIWPAGRLVKEYTILLDPPALASRQTARVNAPSAGPRTPTQTTSAAGASPAADSAATEFPELGDGFPIYVGPIGTGAGLWRLAREHGPADATTAQTAMALHRNNQHAFARGDINRLTVGTTLVIPTRAELFALDAATAEQEYATALRGGEVRREPITDVSPEALSRLRLAGAPAEPTATVAGSAPRSVSPSPPGAMAPALEQDLLRALETSESARQETVELRERIKDLETQLADIQTLLQLRNTELARAQGTDAVPGVLAEPTAASDTVLPVPLPLDSEVEARLELPETPPSDVALMPIPDATNVESGLLPVPVPDPVLTDVLVASPAVPPPTPPASPSAPADDADDASTWYALLLPLAGFAGVTALGVVAFSWVAARRRRREDEADSEEEWSLDELDADDLAAPVATVAAPASPGPAPAPAPQDSAVELAKTALETTPVADQPSAPQRAVFSSESSDDFADLSDMGNFDTETDEADILSEADIYIAYGRHDEAQELLRNEMRRYPNRLDIKFKLAEAYVGGRNVAALNALMQSIKADGGDRADPKQWQRLQTLSSQLESNSNAAPGLSTIVFDADKNKPQPVARRAPEPILPDSLADSYDQPLDDLLSLDLNEMPDAPPTTIDGLTASAPPELPDDHSPLQFSEQLLNTPSSPPAHDTLDLELDIDSFGDALTVLASKNHASLLPDSFPIPDPSDEWELARPTAVPSPNLLDELDSAFDSMLLDEPIVTRASVSSAQPSGLPTLSFGTDDTGTPGLPPLQESAPTDLLSSQWQMDSDIWDETATKLDLARAYIEMDDADAAREILSEVILEGRDEQRAAAEALLRKLA